MERSSSCTAQHSTEPRDREVDQKQLLVAAVLAVMPHPADAQTLPECEEVKSGACMKGPWPYDFDPRRSPFIHQGPLRSPEYERERREWEHRWRGKMTPCRLPACDRG
jgi:hypothetical protein